MGTIRKFDLSEYIEKYNSNFFIETGTYRGDGVEYATKFRFDKIFSVEINKEFHDKNVSKFIDYKNVFLINHNSIDGLTEILVKNKVGRTIFWLDAHLPNFYSSEYSSDYVEHKNTLIPLEEELKVIKNNKDTSSDIFIIDDLRIYERGAFSGGEWLDVINSGLQGIEFVFDLLGQTHNITKIYDHEGYILCVPKNN